MRGRKGVEMSNKERDAIGIFLLDLYHNKQVRRRMQEVKEMMPKKNLLAIVEELEEKKVLDEDEVKYLRNKINGLYGK